LLMLLCCGPGVTITNSSLDAKKMMMLFTNIAEFPNIREFRLCRYHKCYIVSISFLLFRNALFA
jgi:hypothetical protein